MIYSEDNSEEVFHYLLLYDGSLTLLMWKSEKPL